MYGDSQNNNSINDQNNNSVNDQNNTYNNQYQNNNLNNDQNNNYNNQYQNNNTYNNQNYNSQNQNSNPYNNQNNNYNHQNTNYNNQVPPQQINFQQGYTFGNQMNQQAASPGMNYNFQPPFQKKAPVLGTLSIILAFITFIVSVYQPVVGIAFSVLIIVLCIVAFVRKEKLIAMPIIGIILGTLLLAFSFLVVLADVLDYEDEASTQEEQFKGQDVFSGRILIMGDGSALYLFNDGTYTWYQEDTVKDDNFYSGTFKVYNADAARDYMVNDLEEYEIDGEELDDYFQRNIGDTFYVQENLYCLAMDCNYRLVGGVETTAEEDIIPYCGFSDGESYDMTNLYTGNNIVVNETRKINDEN